LPAVFSDRRGAALGGGRIDIGHQHVCAAAGEAFGDGRADAPTGARHQS
jgi:hypothetical protein